MVSALLRPLLPEGDWRHDLIEAGGCRFHVTRSLVDPAGAGWLVLPEAARSWWSFAPALARASASGMALTVLEPRGVGATDKPPGPYGLDAAAADLIAVAGTLGAPPHLLGHGWGGVVAARAAHLRPESFGRLVALGPTPPDRTPARLRAAGLHRRLGPDRLQLAVDRLGPGADPALCRRAVAAWPGPQRVTAALRNAPRRLPELAVPGRWLESEQWLPETEPESLLTSLG